MTIASEIAKSQTNLMDSYTAVSNNGGTLPQAQNFDNLPTAIESIPSKSHGKYKLFERIKDDNNNEIGTVVCYTVDSNDIEYAVVCLDAQYRGYGQILNTNVGIPDLPTLNNWASIFWGSYKMSGKEITDIIIQFCNDNNYASSACTLCRNLSFTIDGVTYSGQTPTANEIYNILCNRALIEAADITASSYTSNNLSSAKNMLTNAVYVGNYILYFNTGGRMADNYITATYFICPVLELPNQEQTPHYELFDRVKDDNNNEIGTVSSFFTDGDGIEYAVVCLDAQYRIANGFWGGTASIAGYPEYSTKQNALSATETATFNTEKIIQLSTSTVCTECRNKIFTVSGVTYYGQMPNLKELSDIYDNISTLNSADISASDYPSLVIPQSGLVWSSTQQDDEDTWVVLSSNIDTYYKRNYGFTIPVLEIPVG